MEAESAWLRGLGAPEKLARLAQEGEGFSLPWKANSHVHLPPNFSAFQSVGQAVSLAAEQGVRVLGASNYYDFEVYIRFTEEGRRSGVFPLFGLEVIALVDELQRKGVLINDPDNPGRMYVCGKGIVRFATMTVAAEKLIRKARRNDGIRMRLMVELLERRFTACGLSTGLDEKRIVDSIVSRYDVHPRQVCLQERHLAQAFQEAFFTLVPLESRNRQLSLVLGCPSRAEPRDALQVQNEIRTRLMKVGKPAFVPEQFAGFEQALQLIVELGGIPCYPTLADGTSPICPYEDPPEKLVQLLKRNRIFCAEFVPVRNRPEILAHYVRIMREAGLVVLAGTEHNTPDLIPLEPLCLGGSPIPEGIAEIFREGACVVAAHQYLAAYGQCGYVDPTGALNPSFHSVEKRIDYFRRLGAAVIAGYYGQNSK